MVVNVQDAILRGLYDDDLTVVQAALSIDELTGVVSPPLLLKAYRHVLSKCIEIINKGQYGITVISNCFFFGLWVFIILLF